MKKFHVWLTLMLILLPGLTYARYRGQTYQIPCNRGGFNYNTNISAVPPEAMISNSRNIDLHNGGREKRGGTAHVNAAVYSVAAKITGVFDYTQRDTDQFILVATDDGEVYKNATDTIITSGSTTKYWDFETVGDKVYMVDGTTYPRVWDGSASTADILSGVQGTDISFSDGTAASGGIGWLLNPDDGDKIWLNGIEFTILDSVIDRTKELTRGGSLATTLSNIVSALNNANLGSSHPEISVATYSTLGSKLIATYDTKGTVGNDYTLKAKSSRGVAVDGIITTTTIVFDSNVVSGNGLEINQQFMLFRDTPGDETIQIKVGASLAATLDEIVGNLNDPDKGGSQSEINIFTFIENGVDTLTITKDTPVFSTAHEISALASDVTVSGDSNCTLGKGENATIARTSADFLTRNFAVGKAIRVDNSASNDGSYTIDTLVAGTLTLTEGTLTSENAGAKVTITWGLPADWTGTNFPTWIIKHARGNNERLWAGGVPSVPHRVYASSDDTPEDFAEASVINIPIETGDGFGIVGAVEWGNRLFCFGKNRTFIIDDTDADTTKWGYEAAQWTGGAAANRLIVKLENDIVFMLPDGDMTTVRAVEQHGDYKRASIARPAFIDQYMRDNVNLSQIEDFHAIYDPELRAVRFFVSSAAQTDIDKCLVYFIDRPTAEAWSINDNRFYSSGFNASAAGLIRVGEGDYQVYTGDYNGWTWNLNQNNRNDNNNPYYAGFTTTILDLGNGRTTKRFDRGWLVGKATGNYDITVGTRIDEGLKTTNLVNVGGAVVWGQTGIKWGAPGLVWGSSKLSQKSFSVGDVGRRIQIEISNSTVNQSFFIQGIYVDFEDLGSQL